MFVLVALFAFAPYFFDPVTWVLFHLGFSRFKAVLCSVLCSPTKHRDYRQCTDYREQFPIFQQKNSSKRKASNYLSTKTSQRILKRRASILCSGQPYLQYWHFLTTFDEVPMNINESVAISKNFQPSFGRPGQTQRTQKIQSDIRNWFQQCSTSDLGGQGTKTKTYLIAFGFHPWR